jgi:hypothetical protein
MSYEDQQRRLRMLAQGLAQRGAVTPEEAGYLARCLHEISMGKDANDVFGTRRKRGQKIADVDARMKISFILQWIACAIEPENGDVPPMTLTAALEAASEKMVPLANEIWGNVDGFEYSVEYLKACWDNPRYRHMRSPDRTAWDDDFPFFKHK